MEESTPEFSSSIMRTAVTQICQSVGYHKARTSAIHTLSNIAVGYLEALAKSAADSANYCGRTQSNLIDVVIAFEDLGSVRGFAGASSSSSTMNSSSLLKEIRNFIFTSDEIPFARPLPLPVENFTRHRRDHHHYRRRDKVIYSCEINLGHVPIWLPKMPAIEGRKDVKIEGDIRVQKTVVAEDEGRRDGKGIVLDLPEKRRKVRFEMGLKGKNTNAGGVLSRVGIGKRVFCHDLGFGTSASDTIIEEEERRRKPIRR